MNNQLSNKNHFILLMETAASPFQLQELNEILERITDGFFVVNREWRFTYINRQFEEMFSIKRECILNKSLWDHYPSLTGVINQEHLCRAMQENVTVNFEQLSPVYYRWFEVTTHPTKNGLSVFVRDITTRKLTEETLRQFHERFRLAAKTDAIYDWDFTTNYLFWGEGLQEMFGYTPDELQIEQWEAALYPEEKEWLLKDLYQTLSNPLASMWKREYRIRRKDGAFCYVFERGHILRDENGKAVRMVGIMQNITEQKTAEEELRRLSLVAKETVNAVFVTDTQHCIIWINDAFTKITGYTLEDAQGKIPSELLDTPEANQQTLACMREMAFSGKSFRVEILNRTKTNQLIWCDSSYQPVHNEWGEIIQYFCIITDISQRKKFEQELAQQRRMTTTAVIQGQERERAQIGRELHDNINQVLTSVKLYQELMLAGLGNKDELLPKSMQLLQQSIDDIRSLSKCLSAPTLGNIRLQDSVGELLDSIRATNKFEVTVNMEVIYNLEVTEDLHLALYRILQEQLTNVLKHAEASFVEVDFDRVGTSLVLSIHDNGKGFDPKQKRHGIGITNMIMRAESLNGSLTLSSVPGKGCRMIASFPLQQ